MLCVCFVSLLENPRVFKRNSIHPAAFWSPMTFERSGQTHWFDVIPRGNASSIISWLFYRQCFTTRCQSWITY